LKFIDSPQAGLEKKMAKTQMRGLVNGLLLAAGLMTLMSNAHAVWTFNSASGATASAGDAGLVSVSGAYAANNVGDTGFATGGTWTSGTTAANLAYYSGGGLGMSSDTPTTAPNHALDNVGNTESVLLKFDSSVILNQIGLGYVVDANQAASTADISLFRYIGSAAAPSLNGVKSTKADMLTAGWELVGNYADLIKDTDMTAAPNNTVNAGAKGSSWWMISAYNTGYGTGTNLDMGNDFFKLYALGGTKCTSTTAGQCGPGTDIPQVPEPGSLVLAGIAFAGLAFTRRQAKRKN
jgi:hypothetical protein